MVKEPLRSDTEIDFTMIALNNPSLLLPYTAT